MKPVPNPGVLEIAPYAPGRATVPGCAKPIKLSANENPLGCSERARAAYLAAASELHLYPDANTSRLRAAIAEKYALEPERLVFGAGSDEIFAMVCQAYLGPGAAMVQPQYGFAAWAIAARAAGAAVIDAPECDYTVCADALAAAVHARTKIVFVANPANPTGTMVPFSDIKQLHAALPAHVLLVLDGAYAECAHRMVGYEDGLAWAGDKSNVIVTRTFSKLYGLASLRIGWGYTSAEIAETLNRIRLPFSVPRAGEAAALAALADEAFLARSVARVREGRAHLAQLLRGYGLPVLEPAANFVTACFAGRALSAAEVEAALAERGVLVRGLKNYGMPDWLRISIGAEHEQAALEAALAGVLR
ncbi:MAG TPA: histidinol-phosphate transaminase [Vitreimonas sp.]|uniref:histidinol-phosphate transaminase n=1 Tax=Vitreimonas sp. TaxID=3069702 RepID=UPI002D65BA14|nr:histidinol-phosphate transaminase [Vitreimonas sp.]HYD88085.1 histidinol-phosphate transaminase [Vitreimonas sp.]